MSEEPETLGRRKRVDGLQLGPRKRPFVCYILYNDFKTKPLAGVLPIHWFTTDVISEELSMHYAISRPSLPTGSYEWVS